MSDFVKKATVVNISKDEAFDVYMGRPGKGYAGPFGNPFTIPSRALSRAESIAKHKGWFRQRLGIDPEFLAKVLALRGKRLGCFCVPKPCHADVIAEFVNHVEERAAENPAMPSQGNFPFGCSICSALMFTQLPHQHKQCQACGRWYCASHLPQERHACPTR